MSVAEVENQEEIIEEVVEEQSVGADEQAQVEAEAAEAANEEADDEEIEITIGEASLTSEDQNNEAPQWVKDLRKRDRENTRKIKEMERLLAQQNSPEIKALGEKPTLESMGYEEEAFEAALLDWNQKKRQADEKIKAQEELAAKQTQEWNEKLSRYEAAKKSLKVKDYEDVEASVMSTLDDNQRGILIDIFDNPEYLVYAIGRDENRLAELAKVKNYGQFIRKVAQLEKDMKVTKKKPVSQPERTVKGNASSSATDTTLEKLREEADRTGNRSKVVAYLRQNRK